MALRGHFHILGHTPLALTLGFQENGWALFSWNFTLTLDHAHYHAHPKVVMSRKSESYRNQLIRKLLDGAPDEVLVELVNIKETIMIRRNVSQVGEPV